MNIHVFIKVDGYCKKITGIMHKTLGRYLECIKSGLNHSFVHNTSYTIDNI